MSSNEKTQRTITCIDDIIEVMKAQRLRVTQSRIAVAGALLENSEKLHTPEEIHQQIKETQDYHCDQVSVYRVLAKFEEIGVVKKSQFQGEAARYTLKNSGHGHEHYFKCVSCEVIEPFHDCLISKKETELKKQGYKSLQHHLEITGLCPSCAQ